MRTNPRPPPQGSEYQLFSTSTVPLYKKMFQEMSFLSSDESMALVQKGKYAYIYFKSNLNIIVGTQFTNSNGETDLHVAAEEFFPGGYAWSFPKVGVGSGVGCGGWSECARRIM